jgi:DNA-binding NtrC family response regulator
VPARIVIVHDDEDLFTGVVVALRAAGHDVAAFKDPLLAHDALEAAQRVEVLITRVEFPLGRSNGISLALMTRMRRPGAKVLFVAREEYLRDAEGLGAFLSLPTPVESVVAAVERMLAENDSSKDRP